MYLEELIKYCNKIYELGFVTATDGNVSIRTGKNSMLITKNNVCKGEVIESDFIEIEIDATLKKVPSGASTESKLHSFIYSKREEINAVIHAHPVYATAIATSNFILDKPYFPEVILSIGRIPLCKYATPSTDKLHESLSQFVSYANVFLLQNHGAVSCGENLKQAFFRMEKLEHTAKIFLSAKHLGGLREINRAELNELYTIAESTYGVKLHSKNRF